MTADAAAGSSENDAAEPDVAALQKKISRLERRLERERQTREELEEIAESGTRRLFDLNEELEDLIKERTDSYEEARRALVSADNWKTEFLGSLSHEVRTPMNGLLGMLELLRDTASDPDHELWYTTAVSSAERLDRTFTRLLKVIELETLDLRHKLIPVEVGSVVAAQVEHWTPHALKRGQLVVASIAPSGLLVDTIESRLADILGELMSNAVAHASSGSVRVSADSDSESVRIAIEDSGPGMDPKRAELLTEPVFRRSPDAWASDGSMALGLGLVSGTAQAIGAELRLESRNGGTAALVRLPKEQRLDEHDGDLISRRASA